MQTEKIAKVSADEFGREISGSRIPLVVDFYADWCPPCKMVSPILEELSGEYGEKVKFVKVNVDDAPALASRLGIMSIPTILFFRGGKAFDAVIGAAPEETFRQKTEEMLKEAGGATVSG